MLHRAGREDELHRVNLLIRALSEEMADQRSQEPSESVSAAMEEALYELRLRKLLISAFVGSDQPIHQTARH